MQLFNTEKTTSINDVVQTSDIINQKKKIMISNYHFKASQLDDNKWRKILKKYKQVSNSLDKKLLLIQRLCKRHEHNDNNIKDKKVEKNQK